MFEAEKPPPLMSSLKGFACQLIWWPQHLLQHRLLLLDVSHRHDHSDQCYQIRIIAHDTYRPLLALKLLVFMWDSVPPFRMLAACRSSPTHLMKALATVVLRCRIAPNFTPDITPGLCSWIDKLLAFHKQHVEVKLTFSPWRQPFQS